MSTPPATPPVLQTERLVLRAPPPALAPVVLAYFERNRAHLAETSPDNPRRFTEGYWRERLEAAPRELAEDRALRLFLFERAHPEGPVIGSCSFTEIVRGPFQACYLGYGLDEGQVGRGLMYEALRAAIDHAFERMRLHRIMANHLPHNHRSARLLARLGFAVEGTARDYLFVDGAWRDHVLTALINPGRVAPGI